MFNAPLFRATREGCGLSLRQLAIAANVDDSWLSRLEAGKLYLIDYPKIARASAAMAVDPAVFFDLGSTFTQHPAREEVSH